MALQGLGPRIYCNGREEAAGLSPAGALVPEAASYVSGVADVTEGVKGAAGS